MSYGIKCRNEKKKKKASHNKLIASIELKALESEKCSNNNNNFKHTLLHLAGK